MVYCNIALAKDMEKYSIKHLREQVAKEMQEEKEKLKQANMITPSQVVETLTREEMVPYTSTCEIWHSYHLVRHTLWLQSAISIITDSKS